MNNENHPIKNEENKLITFFKSLKKIFRKISKKLKKLSFRYPRLFLFMQLTFLYSYAILTLIFSITDINGSFPEPLYKFVPYITQIFKMTFLRALVSPEKTFALYLLVTDSILNSKSASIILKYHLLLVFMIEMLGNLAISVWDLFVHRDTSDGTIPFIFSYRNASYFFTTFFLFMYFLYIYCYLNAIQYKLVSFPKPFQKITDSVGFWLHLKRIDLEKEYRKDK